MYIMYFVEYCSVFGGIIIMKGIIGFKNRINFVELLVYCFINRFDDRTENVCIVSIFYCFM